ncbi:MAG: hypothetical protein OXF45_06370, partial [Candidatus Dadabacteria bacterium]|nr:hypothetical protein [Candidatus Dadabacteria bacterium]
MGKKRKTRRRHHIKAEPSGSQPGARQNQQRARADRKPFGGKYDVVFAVLPALIIILAVLWDWTTRLGSDGWSGSPDVSIFMSMGQRLAEGILNWTRVFYDNKPLVIQFLFYPPALLGSYNVWYLMNMGGCLIGAYSVYAIVRDVFSEARGFSRNVGHYAGLYGGVFTLYLVSAAVFDPHHINTLPVCMALAATVLTKRYVARSGSSRKVALLLLACFCASLSVGIRPYFIPFVGLIPLWVSIAAQLDDESGGVNYRSTANLFLVWNTCVGLFLLCVNVLPYVVAGEFNSFIAGFEMTRQKTVPSGLKWTLGWLTNVYNHMGSFSTLLFFSWAAFLALFLTGFANRLYNRAVAFDLLILTIIAPFSILAMTFAKNFWPHYSQFFLPFIGIGAVSLFVLIHGKHYLRFLFRYKAIAVIPALFFISPA